MKTSLIVSLLAIIALSAPAQTAHVSISVPDGRIRGIACQSLNEYSFIDSVILDSGGQAGLDVRCCSAYQFFRLIAGNSKLPMILMDGDSASVALNVDDIWQSRISGSAESEYFLRLINQYLAGGAESCLEMMEENPERAGNLFIASMLDIGSHLELIKSIAARFKDSGIAIAEILYSQTAAAPQK